MDLKELVKARMERMHRSNVDDFTYNEWEHITPDMLESYYEDEWEYWFNSDRAWWDFDLANLTIQNINELLSVHQQMQEDYDTQLDGSSVEKLLKLYGVWISKQHDEEYIQRFQNEILNNRPDNN
jgi:hypothetical protein